MSEPEAVAEARRRLRRFDVADRRWALGPRGAGGAR